MNRDLNGKANYQAVAWVKLDIIAELTENKNIYIISITVKRQRINKNKKYIEARKQDDIYRALKFGHDNQSEEDSLFKFSNDFSGLGSADEDDGDKHG